VPDLAKAFSSEVGTGSHSNQVYADCVDLSAVENASKIKNAIAPLLGLGAKMRYTAEGLNLISGLA
jgi:hypothetical protein